MWRSGNGAKHDHVAVRDSLRLEREVWAKAASITEWDNGPASGGPERARVRGVSVGLTVIGSSMVTGKTTRTTMCPFR
jgi:hypothetical protein